MISSKKLFCNSVLMKRIILKQLATKSEVAAASTSKKKLNDSALRKWTIVSPLVENRQLSAQLVTGIEVTPTAATWAVLDIHLNEVVDCGTYPLFSEDIKACSSVIIELVHKVKEMIPQSDLFVLEEKLWTKGIFKSNNDMGVNLLTFQAMLYALLNENFIPDDPLTRVFYLQTKAILKLFKLKVGNERVSSQHIVQKMMRRSDVGYMLDNRWENMGSLEVGSDHYGQLSWTNPEMIKRIWTRDELWRENVSNAILAANAFTDLCLKEDGNALRLLWMRD